MIDTYFYLVTNRIQSQSSHNPVTIQSQTNDSMDQSNRDQRKAEKAMAKLKRKEQALAKPPPKCKVTFKTPIKLKSVCALYDGNTCIGYAHSANEADDICNLNHRLQWEICQEYQQENILNETTLLTIHDFK